MGKNKNKGFDFAKRQEKNLKRMAKPMYKTPVDSAYLVITRPFGMGQSPAGRGSTDINRVSAWVSWVLRKRSVVEVVYTMSTRDEIIVKVPKGIDIAPLLGKHKFYEICSNGFPDPTIASCIYEYDYERGGDPASHSWKENIVSDEQIPPGFFRDPYPTPTWAPKPSQLSVAVFPLPDFCPRSPPPEPLSLPEVPKSTQQPKAEPDQPPRKLFESKLDPYDEDKDAVELLRSAPPMKDEDIVSPIKHEGTEYAPSQQLRDEIARLTAERSQSSARVKEEHAPRVKHEPEPAEYTPSPGLMEEFAKLEAQRATSSVSNTPAPGVKQETSNQPHEPSPAPSRQLLDEFSRFQSQRPTPDDAARPVKHEPGASQVGVSPLNGSVPSELGQKVPLPSFKKVKREQTEDGGGKPAES
ncbi:hypothetical protein BC834DRAFT_617158 [Gloeopeniophorella convolvens]|nr:hypothetical protein BC834DRAFT_617158 [Gloeopeniophorella convolvens]